MKKKFWILWVLIGMSVPGYAQQQRVQPALRVASCGNQSYSANSIGYVTIDLTGALCINGTITGGNAAASATGAAVPAAADYIGASVAGTLTGVTATNNTGKISLDVNITGGSSGNGAASNTGSAVPAQAGYTGVNVGGNLVGVTGTGTSMNVTAITGSTTAVTNISGTVSLPTGASTAAKQPAPGTAGTASADVITVQGITSMTPLLVTLSGTNNINAVTTVSTVTSLTQFNGVAISLGAGNTDTGTLRVNLATNAAATAAATPLAVRASDGTSFISDAAIGAAVTSNPVPAGCKNETSATTISNTQAGQLHCDTAQNLMVTGWLSSNGAAAATNRVATLPAIAYSSYANGTAYSSGNNAAPTVGTDGLLWTANLPAIRPASYTASKNFAASSTTDNACIFGNGTTDVLLTQAKLSGTQTTAGIQNLAVLKRSTAESGGTAANFTVVPDYSGYAAASTTPVSYTGTGPTVGTPVGDIDDNYVGLMAPATAAPDDIYVGDWKQKPIVLHGTGQGVCLNLGGAVSGGNISVVFKYIEITPITP